jgi:FMN phosphatase YigB (HAD superfamily)
VTAAIVHYHLGPGGVTSVIAAASRALAAADIPHVILIGGEKGNGSQTTLSTVDRASCREPASPPILTIPGLGYLTSAGNLTASALAVSLRAAAQKALGSPPDVWHFHNHSLGKNVLLAGVVANLAEAGETIILQIHDLAEDGRPVNQQAISGQSMLYPFSPRIHYAFLNSRDLRVFTASGLPPGNASVLANPITSSFSPSTIPNPSSPLLFAPVRGIRRKNLGELVFLSAIAPQGTRIAISRAPLNPGALAIHDRWSRFARRQGLPVGFGVTDRFTPEPGASADFESWISHASHIISTSVAEGFGLPFLEAAAHVRPLIGRNIRHLTDDHAGHGIRAGDLYDQLLVPEEWIDFTILRDHLQTTLERNYRCNRRHISNEMFAATLGSLRHEGWLDFGNLPEPLQQGAIERLKDPASRKVPLVRQGGNVQPAAVWLEAAIANRTPAATPDQLAPYSMQAYQENLALLYTRMAVQPASPVCFVSPEKILNSFLAPDSFHFLLSAPPPAPTLPLSYRAVVFDIYGTLLIAPAGGVRPDPDADPMLRKILENAGYLPPESPSTALHEAVLRHHAAAGVPFPEIDLRVLWREVLALKPGTDTTTLVEAIESAWHPARLMPGAEVFVRRLARSGISLGLLSNAQCNSLASLGGIAGLFAPELTILSYQHGIAKPSPELFQTLADRLAGRGIAPEETLYIGNDPIQDILPAAARGFKTGLFTGHPDSLRSGECKPDVTLTSWP